MATLLVAAGVREQSKAGSARLRHPTNTKPRPLTSAHHAWRWALVAVDGGPGHTGRHLSFVCVVTWGESRVFEEF